VRKLRASQTRSFAGVSVKRWALDWQRLHLVLFGLFRGGLVEPAPGRTVIASILKLGVSDHVICAIQGHNYPEVANRPDQIRERLGARYAPLLQVGAAAASRFETSQGASSVRLPGSDRKYVHFITRGHGNHPFGNSHAAKTAQAIPETTSSSVRTHAAFWYFTRTTSAGWKSRLGVWAILRLRCLGS